MQISPTARRFGPTIYFEGVFRQRKCLPYDFGSSEQPSASPMPSTQHQTCPQSATTCEHSTHRQIWGPEMPPGPSPVGPDYRGAGKVARRRRRSERQPCRNIESFIKMAPFLPHPPRHPSLRTFSGGWVDVIPGLILSPLSPPPFLSPFSQKVTPHYVRRSNSLGGEGYEKKVGMKWLRKGGFIRLFP